MCRAHSIIRYYKPPWALARSVIESNGYEGLKNYWAHVGTNLVCGERMPVVSHFRPNISDNIPTSQLRYRCLCLRKLDAHSSRSRQTSARIEAPKPAPAPAAPVESETRATVVTTAADIPAPVAAVAPVVEQSTPKLNKNLVCFLWVHCLTIRFMGCLLSSSCF